MRWMQWSFWFHLPLSFTHSLTKTHLLQLKIDNIWKMGIFGIKKILRLCMNNVLKPKSYILLFLIKLSTDVRFSSYLLDFSSKDRRYFKTFLQVIVSILYQILKCKIFWQKSFYFTNIFPCLKITTSYIQRSIVGKMTTI